MHVITRGQSNTLYFTLLDNKKVPSDLAYYHFFKFVNDMSKEEVFVMSDRLSEHTSTARYTKAVFTEGTDVTLTLEGFWSYTIYEVTTNTLTDDSELTADEIVEQGKVFVKDNNVTEVSYTQYTPTDNTNTTNTNTVYLNI